MQRNAAEKTDSYKRKETIGITTTENNLSIYSPEEHARDANSHTILFSAIRS